MAGYHVSDIPKGSLGGFSKIEEEFLEFKDAVGQYAKLMALQELSDMIGAIQAYLKEEYGNRVTIQDLEYMAEITKRAFETGHRK